MKEELKEIERFHGHIGPYVVIGYRMGVVANRILGDDPFSKFATVFTGKNPPMSCIIDGIQIASGCTIGKGNIEVKDEHRAKAVFTDGKKSIEIVLKPDVKERIERSFKEGFEIIDEIINMPDYELFDIKVEYAKHN